MVESNFEFTSGLTSTNKMTDDSCDMSVCVLSNMLGSVCYPQVGGPTVFTTSMCQFAR